MGKVAKVKSRLSGIDYPDISLGAILRTDQADNLALNAQLILQMVRRVGGKYVPSVLVNSAVKIIMTCEKLDKEKRKY